MNCMKCEKEMHTINANNKVYYQCLICGKKQRANYLKIDKMYAFLSIDPEDNNEGIIGVEMNGAMMPLIGADIDRIESMKPMAKESARRSNMKVKLVEFSVRKTLDEF